MFGKRLEKILCTREFENLRSLNFDLKRRMRRLTQKKMCEADSPLLNMGSGGRPVKGWVNVDIGGADVNVDLSYGKLPFPDSTFEGIVSQHVVEHLYIDDELIPILRDCHRCLKNNGELWLSTPDMEKIIESYLKFKCKDLIDERESRISTWRFGDYPSQHMLNFLWHQESEHKNLFDFGLLEWCLNQAGFEIVRRADEGALLERFSGFPARNDDLQSLYVVAVKS